MFSTRRDAGDAEERRDCWERGRRRKWQEEWKDRNRDGGREVDEDSSGTRELEEEVWKETDCYGWDTRPLIASTVSFYNYSLPPPFYSPPLSVINYSSIPILLPPLCPPVSPFFIFPFKTFSFSMVLWHRLNWPMKHLQCTNHLHADNMVFAINSRH